ncbi:NHL repeat-containing protein [Gimesia aquarii]|nr:PQQ-binding-like beta-propeller repeat protein [Gimesia aquarii]
MILTCLFVNASAYAERLVLVSASYGKNIIAICDQQGNVIWSQKTAGPSKGHAGHHDIHLLPNGNILYHDSWTKTTEMTLDKQVVWSYDSATMNGNNGKRVDVHAFARLPNGNTMITESGVGRIIEVDRDGKIMHQFPLKKGGTQSTRLVRITPQGNYLVCSEQPGVVTEYNRKGEVVWDYLIKTRVYGAIRLKNGNTLIASGSGNSVVEVSPDKKVVWEIRGRVPKTDVQLKWTTCLQELDNGNMIIGNCHAGPDNPQIFELDGNKKIVWEFDEYDLVGNGLACWQILDDSQSAMVRKKLSALTP